MTYGEYLSRLQRQVSRTDVGEDEYADYAQQALKRIQENRSWGCMKTSGQVTMLEGQTTVNLPNDYKELQSGVSPIRVQYTGAGYLRPLPCQVKTKREFEREYAKFSYGVLSSFYFRYNVLSLPVYIDQSKGVWTLNIAIQAQGPITFLLDYYGFLPTPENPNDTNYFLSNYEDMVMAKAKSLCWEGVNDEFAGEWDALYEKKFKRNTADDAYRQTRGVEMRM